MRHNPGEAVLFAFGIVVFTGGTFALSTVGSGRSVPPGVSSSEGKGHVSVQPASADEGLEIAINTLDDVISARQRVQGTLKRRTGLVDTGTSLANATAYKNLRFSDIDGKEFAVVTTDGNGFSVSTVQFEVDDDGNVEWTIGSFAGTPLGRDVMKQARGADPADITLITNPGNAEALSIY